MDRAYCVSLKRDVGVGEAIELFRHGSISSKHDFACLDPKCRASYVCINLGKVKYSVSPYFRTADSSGGKHASECVYEVEDKNPKPIMTNKLKEERHPIEEMPEIMFMLTRRSGFFKVPAPWLVDELNITKKFKYIPAGQSLSRLGAANPKCYSIDSLLGMSRDGRRRVSIDGHSDVVRSLIVPVDKNNPDMYRRYIYCGLAIQIESEDEFITFKFGRPFSINERMYDVQVKLAESTITAIGASTSNYYRDLIGRLLAPSRLLEINPEAPLFIYALGTPRFDSALDSFVVKVDSLDHFYAESTCSSKGFISSEYYERDRNRHYFVSRTL
ncbi:hypothetical protein [Pseudomonas sp. McL0111]|uniref:hypothetical protein n=1 Tax=Pseudomonas sp. McL0111 TaxID=3457357 RepID=UPI00403EB126